VIPAGNSLEALAGSEFVIFAISPMKMDDERARPRKM